MEKFKIGFTKPKDDIADAVPVGGMANSDEDQFDPDLPDTFNRQWVHFAWDSDRSVSSADVVGMQRIGPPVMRLRWVVCKQLDFLARSKKGMKDRRGRLIATWIWKEPKSRKRPSRVIAMILLKLYRLDLIP